MHDYFFNSDAKDDIADKGLDDFDVEPTKRPSNKPKKSVTWAQDVHLEEYFYFELDETERGNDIE